MNARNALHPAVTSEFPIRQVLKRVSERNAFTSAMRAKWNEKLSALLFPSVHRNVITLLCGFCRSCAAFTSRLRVRDELSRLSLCRARALQFAAPN